MKPVANSIFRVMKGFLRTIFVVGLLMFFISLPVKRPDNRLNASGKVLPDSCVSITVCAVGDAMMHMPQINSGYIDSCGCYDFSPALKLIPELTRGCDLSIVNFETTLAGLPYTGYPQFSAPDTIAWNLKQAGFNFFVHANNHTFDRGLHGNRRTLLTFERFGIQHTGVFADSADRSENYPVISNINGFRVAILNYTYGTNGIPVPAPALINMIDTALIITDIQKAKEASPDAIIACMHWGNEYQRQPDIHQEGIARLLIKQGVDVIIGSHPHVIQPVDTLSVAVEGKRKKGLVFWSLGNFFSNQRDRYTDGGLFIRFRLEKNLFSGALSVKEIHKDPVWVYKSDYPVRYLLIPGSVQETEPVRQVLSGSYKTLLETFLRDSYEQIEKGNFQGKEFVF